MSVLMEGITAYFNPVEQGPVILESSWVDEAEYDSTTKTLIVSIADADYYYYGVESYIAEGLFEASSPGTYMNTMIKDYYAYSRS